MYAEAITVGAVIFSAVILIAATLIMSVEIRSQRKRPAGKSEIRCHRCGEFSGETWFVGGEPYCRRCFLAIARQIGRRG